MNHFWTGFEKKAFTSHLQLDPGVLGAAGGLMSGYSAGRTSAKSTANILSQKGSKTKNEAMAGTIAKGTAPLGALIGLSLGYKNRQKLLSTMKKHLGDHQVMNQLYEGVLPFATGTAGGAAAGAGTGALMSLRGRSKKEAADAASEAATYAIPSAIAGGVLGHLSHGKGSSKTRAAATALNALGLGAAGADIGLNISQLRKQRAIEKKL